MKLVVGKINIEMQSENLKGNAYFGGGELVEKGQY
jgi:hypothetical protein